MRADSEEQEAQQQKNPIKRAEKEKQFRTAGQSKDVFTDPQQLFQKAKQLDKTFKMVKNEHPKHKGLFIIDFSLNARGYDQDQIYTKQPFYRSNIRRGNTLLYDENKKKAIWGRKGLIKFFDITQSVLKAIRKDDIMSLNKKDKNNYYIIFPEIENALSCNQELKEEQKAKVHVYRLNKANGENAQVSYCAEIDQWVISSKNVSIFVKDPTYINLYKGERYQFAILIAQTWFNLLREKNKNQIDELKKDLSNKTLIGEYCGNPDFQHLVKYAQITIYFYAAVEKDSSQSCISPPQAFNLLERHNLPIVKNYQQEKTYLGKFTEMPVLGQSLMKVFQQVETASIFEEEEGSVLYFVLEKPRAFCQYISDRYLQGTVPIPPNWQEMEACWKVSSLSKLKTLEYRILRKLRQKLKYFTRLKKGGEKQKDKEFKKFQEKYGSFEKEVHQLLKGQKLSKPIEYYFCIGLKAFQYVYKHHKSAKAISLLVQHYLDFVSVVFWCVENGKGVTQEYMRDEKLHEELRKTTWENYSTDIIKEYPEMLERIVPRYAKIKATMKIEDQEHGEEEEGEKMMQDD